MCLCFNNKMMMMTMSDVTGEVNEMMITRVSAAPDRPPRDAVTQRMLNEYSISDNMVIKPFLLLHLAAEYRSLPWM